MTSSTFIAYFDLLAVGDAGKSVDDTKYFEILSEFRTAMCEAAADELDYGKGDVVYAYSDCAFVESYSLDRLGSFISKLQHELWLKPVYFKGAISPGKLAPVAFGSLTGFSVERSLKLKNTIQGHWFDQSAVIPAEAEKALRGIAMQICQPDNFRSSSAKQWLAHQTIFTAYYSTETNRRPIVIRDLKIPTKYLPVLREILQTYLLESQASRRIGRYYVSLIISWIKSHDFSFLRPMKDKKDWDQPLPEPLQLLIRNKSIRTEVTHHFGAELIFYALLDKVERECRSTVIKEEVYRIIGENKKLVASHDLVPDQICDPKYRRRLLEKRVQKLFR
jgi:hypothetical protein